MAGDVDDAPVDHEDIGPRRGHLGTDVRRPGEVADHRAGAERPRTDQGAGGARGGDDDIGEWEARRRSRSSAGIRRCVPGARRARGRDPRGRRDRGILRGRPGAGCRGIRVRSDTPRGTAPPGAGRRRRPPRASGAAPLRAARSGLPIRTRRPTSSASRRAIARPIAPVPPTIAAPVWGPNPIPRDLMAMATAWAAATAVYELPVVTGTPSRETSRPPRVTTEVKAPSPTSWAPRDRASSSAARTSATACWRGISAIWAAVQGRADELPVDRLPRLRGHAGAAEDERVDQGRDIAQ